MLISLLLLACSGAKNPVESKPPEESPAPVDSESVERVEVMLVDVFVTLDGEPTEGITVLQGGLSQRWSTDADGYVQVPLDLTLDADHVIIASHPEARLAGEQLFGTPDAGEPLRFDIALQRFLTAGNEAYTFQDPGQPNIEDSTNQCSHCHKTIVDAWWGSPHRSSAENPTVQDLYAGAAQAYADAGSCSDAGGRWLVGLEPGTGASGDRCYLGDGVLPDLNPGCGEEEGCEHDATAFGACADCHAPGIDGALGGRDLLEARGYAHSAGVHCDVCHKVESIDLEAPAGVAGRLHVLRPREEFSGPLGPYEPLMFGPYYDVLNPRMGSVQRDHFREAELCAGCHELEQEALIPGQAIDVSRWPEGRIPVHSTYSEWLAGPMAEGVVCQSCHMPVDADVGNSSDLGNVFDVPPGIAGGWYREPGAVRQHSWVGPRQPESRMLQLAAAVELSGEVSEGTLAVEAVVRNVGPGHAIPTGEPLRTLLLLVEARCDGTPLQPIGGDVVSDVGGALERRGSEEDWTLWPGASPGELLRVVERPGGWVDYEGHGPFGDGRFSVEDKGLPVERFAGQSRILAVDAEGRVTLDTPLAAGAVVYRVPDGSPSADTPSMALAGAPGQAFARVLVDSEGRRMVPHHRAVDVASDNRLLPGASWTSTHTFEASCEEPELRALLLHRAFPLELAEERGWGLTDSVMVEVVR
ncbi:MAG: hypothetical protein H6741_27595 [Alphaproteobacteria bacterium]|nr:hypothetical protein [Alphaproteobacteria bacterium]